MNENQEKTYRITGKFFAYNKMGQWHQKDIFFESKKVFFLVFSR